mgnify:CR=1 FL=1
MLVLIGLGICGDLTLRGVEEAKGADEVYSETHTGILQDGWLKKTEKTIGKKIKILGREILESGFLLKSAKEKKIALLVPGDPLAATTHHIHLHEGKLKGIETRVIHNSSIFTSAPGICGLQNYKFGRTATLAYWRKNYGPTSALEIAGENTKNGSHTLLLLDLDKALGPMDAKTAFFQIEKMEKKLGRKIIGEIAVLSRVGWADERISYGKIPELKKADLGKPPFCFIIPGKLHFAEKESLETFRA